MGHAVSRRNCRVHGQQSLGFPLQGAPWAVWDMNATFDLDLQRFPNTCRQHEAIHVAIGARDPDSERWRMSDHLRWSEDIIGAAIATTGGSTFKERRASWATGEGRLSDG
jgi:hypothetical protein